MEEAARERKGEGEREWGSKQHFKDLSVIVKFNDPTMLDKMSTIC